MKSSGVQRQTHAAEVFGCRSRDPSGPAVIGPRQQAGHMTALQPSLISADQALNPRGRSHMDPIRWTTRAGLLVGVEAALTHQHSPNSARKRIFDGAAEAKLIALACSAPPQGRARWTLALLETAMVELNIVDRASDNAIGRTLKKCAQAPPPGTMGHPTRGQRRLRSRHGGCARSLPTAA